MYYSLWQPISELQSVTCHMKSPANVPQPERLVPEMCRLRMRQSVDPNPVDQLPSNGYKPTAFQERIY